jgi:hypothetical protein
MNSTIEVGLLSVSAASRGKALVEFESATRGLRPAIDFAPGDESDEQKFNRRYKRFLEAGRDFQQSVEGWKLFLSDEIYKSLREIQHACSKEGMSFEMSFIYGEEPGKFTVKDFLEARGNIEGIELAIETTLSLIRKRFEIQAPEKSQSLQKLQSSTNDVPTGRVS